jgi:hypothetical protein
MAAGVQSRAGLIGFWHEADPLQAVEPAGRWPTIRVEPILDQAPDAYAIVRFCLYTGGRPI